MFTLYHQDGDFHYKFEKGGYCVKDSKLYLSIETSTIKEDTFPDSFLFAINGCACDESLVNSLLILAKNPHTAEQDIHVYTTFHAIDIRADVQVTLLADATIKVILRILSDDVVYYDERANPNLFYGSAILSKQPLNALWIPT